MANGRSYTCACGLGFGSVWTRCRVNHTLRVQGPKQSGFRSQIPANIIVFGPKNHIFGVPWTFRDSAIVDVIRTLAYPGVVSTV